MNTDYPYVRPEIRNMQGYVPGEQPQTGKYIKLNTNENPYQPSRSVTAAIQEAIQRLPRYPDPDATAFRLQASQLLDVPPQWILCGNGSDDILTIVTRACVPQGGCVRFPYPSYVLYRTLAEIQGARWEAIPFPEDWTVPEGLWRDPDGVHLVYFPNPNSPSGTWVEPEEIEALAQRLPCPLLVDEAYVDFAPSGCVDLVKRNPRVLVSRSLSKSYALAGLRFGYLVAQEQAIREFRKVKDSYNCDSLSIAAATAALADQAWLQQTVQRICRTRERLARGLERLGFQVAPSQANFLWCTHVQEPAQRIYQRLKEHGVLVRYMAFDGWGEGLRITVGTDEQVDALLHLLEQLV